LIRYSDALYDRVLATGADRFGGPEVAVQKELSVARHRDNIADKDAVALIFKLSIQPLHQPDSEPDVLWVVTVERISVPHRVGSHTDPVAELFVSQDEIVSNFIRSDAL